MIKRILYFGNPAYLSTRLEQLVVKYPAIEQNNSLPDYFKKEAEITVPIEDIGMVILDHKQITLTHDLGQKLIEHNAVVLWCDAKHHPIGMTLSLSANDTHSEKTRFQLEASEPLKKQLWRQTIEAKITNQASVLAKFGYPNQALRHLAGSVLSGDSTHLEARAAAIYWKYLLAPYQTNRGRFEGPPNHLLNYGYALLRAIVARNLVGSGLLPVLGIHHRNKYNAYCLADDIMEPFRPIVDQYVFSYLQESGELSNVLEKKDKTYLLGLTSLDVEIEGKTSPLMVGVQRTTSSLMKCFMGERRKMSYPIL